MEQSLHVRGHRRLLPNQRNERRLTRFTGQVPDFPMGTQWGFM